MFFAADYPFMDVVWSMFVFFAWVIWVWLLITVFSDLFRRHDVSGLGKTGWAIFMIVLPYLGVFVYLIAQGKHMAERSSAQAQQNRAEFDDYVRGVATNGGPSDEIAKAKELLDSGAINPAEFADIKRAALA